MFSVCIPCDKKHINFLPSCLDSISKQSYIPEQVVISISDYFGESDKIEQLISPYREKLNIKTLITGEKLFAGENRNKAIEHSDMDVICLIDADDTMHQNRLEIIKTMFSKFKLCDIILHHYIQSPKTEVGKKIKYDPLLVDSYKFSYNIHYGHCSFKKSITKKYKYTNKPRGQDVEFIQNYLVQNKNYYNKILVYKFPLTYYYSDRSTLFL